MTGSPEVLGLLGRTYLTDPVTHISNEERAVELLEAAVQGGDVESMRVLGELYVGEGGGGREARGRGKRGEALLRRAVEADLQAVEARGDVGPDPEAAFLLGKTFELLGAEEEAEVWLRASAEGGYPPAMVRLVHILAKDPPSRRECLGLLKKGASQDDPECLFLLALCYLQRYKQGGNLGLPPDRARAEMLLGRVALEMGEEPRFREAEVWLEQLTDHSYDSESEDSSEDNDDDERDDDNDDDDDDDDDERDNQGDNDDNTDDSFTYTDYSESGT